MFQKKLNCFLVAKCINFRVQFQTNRKMSDKCKNILAVCQITAKNDKDENFKTCRLLIEDAKSRQARIVFFPEACDYVGESKKETFALAECLDGPLMKKYKNLAKELDIWISLGGVHETTSDPTKLKNTHVIINNVGEIAAKYSKAHLFDVDIPEQKIRLMESSYIERGTSISPPVETPIGRVGLSICYDMRFPELSLTLAKAGADILTFPSAFTFATGSDHWETLLRARAIETQCYVVAAAQTGAHNSKRNSWGHAMVVDPWGRVVAQCSEGIGLATAAINVEYSASVRLNMPVWNHRRTDLYPAMKALQVEDHTSSQATPLTYKFGQVSVSRESVFYDTDLTISFTNKRCVVPGHVLVAPIRQVKRFKDLTPNEVSDLYVTVQKIAGVMERLHNVNSSTIVMQDGEEAGQTIQQVHVHVLPRKFGDFDRNDDIYVELQSHDKDEEKPWRTEKEMCDEADVIRKAISSES